VITYRAGESFSEFPGDRHGVSENASATEPARLLAVFVVDTNETDLTTHYEKCGQALGSRLGGGRMPVHLSCQPKRFVNLRPHVPFCSQCRRGRHKQGDA
jgi:hypothetical protein